MANNSRVFGETNPFC